VRRDSAGVPFAGRSLPHAGFAGDHGDADPGLVAALEAFARDPAGEQEVLAALTAARVLVPVVAVATDTEDVGGARVEKSTDMAVVTLVGADGRRALPVFSSVAALASWRPDARPVPVTGARAALAAAAEGADVLVVDVAGPVSYVLDGRRALEPLARGQLAVPAYDDEALRGEVMQAAAVPGVSSVSLVRARDVDALVQLVLEPDADVGAVLAAIGERLGGISTRPLLRGLGVGVLGPGDR
jgi:hypothetical protein